MSHENAIQDQNRFPAVTGHSGTAGTAETRRWIVSSGNGHVDMASFSGSVSSYGMPTKGFYQHVAEGGAPSYSLVHKFGENNAVGTGIVPVCNGGFYRTPGTAASLEVVSSSTNDGSAGTGGQQLTLIGLDNDFVEITQTVEMSGTAPASLGTALRRLYRMYVSRSGVYASQSQASHEGDITVRESGGGDTWATIPTLQTGFGAGQSLIGAYTVPAGKSAYILSATLSVDTNKTSTLYFFQRSNSDDTTSPYSGVLRTQNLYTGVTGIQELVHSTPEKFAEKTDIGFLAKAASASDVSVEFELLIVDN